MAERRRTLRLGLTIILAVSLLVCPLSVSRQLVYTPVQAQGQAGQIEFTPHLATLVVSVTPETTAITTVAPVGTPGPAQLPTPIPTPVLGPIDKEEYAICGWVQVGSGAYPIGDVFENTRGVDFSSVVNGDPFGRTGYARFAAQPEFLLLWTTPRGGGRQYLIVHENDPLFADEHTGFSRQTEVVANGYQSLMAAGVPTLSGAGTLIVLIFVECPATVGTTCALAAGAAIVAGVVGSAYTSWIRLTVIDPALRNLHMTFSSIDKLRGNSPVPCVAVP